jgi:hypothetical protein
MRLCTGIRADGGRCRAQAMRDSAFCLNHDPDRAEENKKRGSKGGKTAGKGRPLTELRALKLENADIRKRLLEGGLQPGVASVAVQSINVDIRIAATALKIREVEELEERIEALEQAEEERMSEHRGSGFGA